MPPTLRRSARLCATAGSSSNPTTPAVTAIMPRPSNLGKTNPAAVVPELRAYSRPPDVATNPCHLLLKLPTELLLSIIHYLNPRDAIALSFTCHAFYDGLLSDKNHFLWHRIGRFKYELPGYSISFDPYIQKRAEFERSKTVGSDTAIENVCSEWTDTIGQNNYPFIFGPSGFDCSEYSRVRKMQENVHNAIKTYDPEFYVDYKGILLSTMRGEAGGRSCCQWCLQCPEPYTSNHTVHRLHTTWDKTNLKWAIGPMSNRWWICCGQCQKENFMSVDEASKLGIDLEGVFCHNTYNMNHYWKPTIQRRVMKRYGEGASISFAHEQWKKELLNLPDFRERHFTAIFANIKSLYAAKAPRDSQLWVLKRNIKPAHLQKDWFFVSSPPGETEEARAKWTKHCNNDHLMQLLRHPEIGDLWKDPEWVKSQAALKIEFIVVLLTKCRRPRAQHTADIPTKKLIRDVTNIALEVQMEKLQAAGLEDLRQRMTETNGHGFECPWTSSDGECANLRFPGTKDFLAHIVTHCWGILVRGDMNWLVGTPSIWWPEDISIQDKTVSNQSNNSKSGPGSEGVRLARGSLTRYEPHLAQEDWLQKWWPERWKPSYKAKLRRWRREWQFFDSNGLTKKDRDEIDDEDDSADESYKPGRA